MNFINNHSVYRLGIWLVIFNIFILMAVGLLNRASDKVEAQPACVPVGNWPSNHYCILRKGGSCPVALDGSHLFNQGEVAFQGENDRSDSNHWGTLGDSYQDQWCHFGTCHWEATHFFLCCK